ncbi:type II toxin-antitoxin system VapC family toxin [Pantoea sp. Fr+CA_20]|uniref:type II toxin-antitoxin system VapC family toxin n=1 Tax=Pantoea TaxID=53335 RepID=UPI002117F538|nr:type II toxin-antitoxin system VapC family toxin [Pantoea sp. Fr+CA_20]
MRYLLDTNVVSELRKAGTARVDPNVEAWAVTVSTDSTFISALTLLEIERGILHLEQRDEEQTQRLRLWYQTQVLEAYRQRTLPVDGPIARRCAQLHVPDRRAETDALIAATALQHDLILVTRNLKDFQGLGVMLLNPWDIA